MPIKAIDVAKCAGNGLNVRDERLREVVALAVV
jgi:hypothetical protein